MYSWKYVFRNTALVLPAKPQPRRHWTKRNMSGQKRKLDQENCVFQAKWETDYLFIEFKGKPMCLVCLETKSAMKDFNLSRHYNTTHKDKYDKYTGAARAAIIVDLRGKIHQQQSFFTKATTTQEFSLKASNAELAQAKKPLSDGI